MRLTPGSLLGHYLIVETIGAGGMGEVYRARDDRLGRDVAIKVLPSSVARDADRLRRFELEARAAAALSHPNILAVFDIGTHEGEPYIVSELLDGRTLRAVLAGDAVGARKAIDWGKQLCHGLAAAHAKGIVHRDIKPDNVFLTTDGYVKLLDFGLAKLVESPGLELARTTMAGTVHGQVLGTVGYMSPEQVRGEAVDLRSDIFSVGVLLYELATGRRAFAKTTPIDTMMAILQDELPAAPFDKRGIDGGVVQVIRRCVEKSPDERFQSARDLAYALEAVSAPRSAQAPALPGAVGLRRSRWLIGSAVAAAATIGVLAGLFLRGGPGTPVVDYRQITFRRGSIVSARFAPGGQTVVLAARYGPGAAGLYAARVDDPGHRALGISGEVAAISHTGEMAVLVGVATGPRNIRRGTLARAPVSGGAPRELLTNVSGASWSPDGSTLAVTHWVPEARLWRVEYPVGKALYETPNWLNEPHLSRDGTRVAFLEHPPNGDDRGAVSVVTLDGHTTALSGSYDSIKGMAWSAESGEVWFTASTGSARRSLYATSGAGAVRAVAQLPTSLILEDIRPDGRVLLQGLIQKARAAVRGPNDLTERDLSWFDYPVLRDLSPDGGVLLFDEQGDGGGAGYSVFVRKTDGSPALRLSSGASGRLSPDGRWATVYKSTTEPMQVIPLGPGESRSFDVGSISGESWAADSRRVVFTRTTGGRPPQVMILDIDTGTVKALTPESHQSMPVRGPEGFVLVSTTDRSSSWLWPLDAGSPRPLPWLTAEDAAIAFSVDGRVAYLRSSRARDAGPLTIDQVTVATGARRLWRAFDAVDAPGGTGTQVLISSDGLTYAVRYVEQISDLFIADGLR